MENDPELSGKYLGTISSDFVKVADLLKEASYHIRQRGISDYPIFPICQESIAIGQMLINRQQSKTHWHYYASFLGEFVERGLVDEPSSFEQAWKDADEFACLFVVDKEFMSFVFIPFPED